MVNDRVRKKVLERDNHRCYHCGTSEGLQIHHRRSKGFGGSKLLDLYQNLIAVCAAYNYAMESDAKTAAEARE